MVIVSGLSGAGKSTVLGVLEDIGYFCMDNIPPDLLLNMISIMKHPSIENKRLAAVIDVRSGESFNEIGKVVDKLKKMGIEVKIIFLDAKEETLVNRYNLTRRKHPLSDGKSSIEILVQHEREKLAKIKEMADYVLDTSLMNSHELRRRIVNFIEGDLNRSLKMSIESFGFKYGIPLSADFMFDARFLPNPYYVEELKDKTGTDKEVQRYFEQFEAVKEYISKIVEILEFVIDNYSKEAKDTLYITIGCTGGKHRSVYIAQKLGEIFKDKISVSVSHRDVSR
ncbi:RNase adapter RapZ [Mesoaciditoga sp.]